MRSKSKKIKKECVCCGKNIEVILYKNGTYRQYVLGFNRSNYDSLFSFKALKAGTNVDSS